MQQYSITLVILLAPGAHRLLLMSILYVTSTEAAHQILLLQYPRFYGLSRRNLDLGENRIYFLFPHFKKFENFLLN
jgi:hypothetical protein